MDTLTAGSGRIYTPLPIEPARGFPQSFPFLFGGKTYHFRLYVNVAASRLGPRVSMLELPAEDAFLVVQVERDNGDGTRTPVFLRKVVPELEYEAEAIALFFPLQRVVPGNLGGLGELGSQVVGGIGER
jgi:hypothetical protein